MATYVPYAWFAKWSHLEQKQDSNAEYEAVKNAFGQKLIDQVFPLYPGNLKVILVKYLLRDSRFNLIFNLWVINHFV